MFAALEGAGQAVDRGKHLPSAVRRALHSVRSKLLLAGDRFWQNPGADRRLQGDRLAANVPRLWCELCWYA